MKKETLYRCSALAGFVSGPLLIVGWTMNLNRDSMTGAAMALTAFVLALFAFMGIYSAQYEQMKVVGLIGFTACIVGVALFIPWVFLDIARLSDAVTQPDWRFVETHGPTQAVGVFGGLGFIIGFVLFGIASLRARVFSRPPAVLLIVAGIMPLIHQWMGVDIGKLLQRIGGLALIWFAWELWRLSRSQSEQTDA